MLASLFKGKNNNVGIERIDGAVEELTASTNAMVVTRIPVVVPMGAALAM